MSTIEMTVSPPDVQSLVGAACSALRQAFERDLPWVDDVETVRDAESDLTQGERRDLYAARRLCNVFYGPLRHVRRRPALVGLRTVIVPHEGGNQIVVLAIEGSAAIYAVGDSGEPTLLHVGTCADAVLRGCAEVALR